MDSKERDTLSLGDAVYIHPDAKVNRTLQRRIAYVNTVRDWGILADIPAESGVYPVRLTWEDFDVIDDEVDVII